MTPKQKWLLLHGSGWIDWVDVMRNNILDVYGCQFDASLFEFDTLQNRIRLRQHEPIRVHVAPSAGVHTIRTSEDNSRVPYNKPQGFLF